MKKARIILACVALLAIVGGALAFKANKFGLGPRAYTYTTITSSTIGEIVYTATGTFCVILTPIVFINTINSQGIITTVYITTLPATVATFSAPGQLTFTRTFLGCTSILTRITQNP